MSEERYVTKRAVFHDIENYIYTHPIINDNELFALISTIPESDVVPVPKEGIGELSDGYHTFNGLYYQRMMLFAALVNVYKDRAWKSWRHEDGEPCFGKDNYFIVGIDTPEGSYTYHYHGEYWDLFNCKELPVAKHWDGHTEKDVTRLLSLSVENPVVLCQDCKCYQQSHYIDNHMECARSGFPVHSVDFCSFGEKRKES